MLARVQQQELKAAARTPSGAIPIRNAKLHNLKDVSVAIPRGVPVAVTGVAGSGKSSLIQGALPRAFPSMTVIDQSRHPRLSPIEPGDLYRHPRADPEGLRIGQQAEARAVQRQLRGRLP